MNETSTIEKDSRLLEEKFFEEVTRIQERQGEIAEIQVLLEAAISNSKKLSQPNGEIVSFEKLLQIKQISETLTDKVEENKQSVLDLYHSVFPDDFFISQDYYKVWIELRPNMIVKFADDLESIEVKAPTDLN